MGYIGIPPAPIVGYIYRGFLLSLPQSVETTNIKSVSYQVRFSTDDDVFTDFEDLATVTSKSNFNFIHDGLYKEVFYQYQYYLTYKDGSTSPISAYAVPGNGTQIYDYSGLDQLAASLGTIQGGFLRGVIFETSPNYPKVRMDPTGFYGISTTSTPVFIDALTGNTYLQGFIHANGIKLDTSASYKESYNGINSELEKIVWIDPDTGPGGQGIGGMIWCTADRSSSVTRLDLVSTPIHSVSTNTLSSQVRLKATDLDNLGKQAELFVSSSGFLGLFSSVTAGAYPNTVGYSPYQRIIIRSDCHSDFIQLAGNKFITTTESTSSTSYTTLPTTDQVSGVVAPSNATPITGSSLIIVLYQATWQESVNGAARAAIFIGNNQVQIANDRAPIGPAVQETQIATTAGTDKVLATYPGGLNGVAGDATAYGGDVTTGQIVGLQVAGGGSQMGACYIFANPGTYNVSIKFKVSSGSVTVKNRKLWVWVAG